MCATALSFRANADYAVWEPLASSSLSPRWFSLCPLLRAQAQARRRKDVLNVPSFSIVFLLSLSAAGLLAACGGGTGSMPSAGGSSTAVAGAVPDGQRSAAATTSSTPAPSGTYWSGTVSGATGAGIVANCGQSNFAQGYGCLPVTDDRRDDQRNASGRRLFPALGRLIEIARTSPRTRSTTRRVLIPPPRPRRRRRRRRRQRRARSRLRPQRPQVRIGPGTVTGLTGAGIVANCGQSNFAQGYGCLPVTTTGATTSGTPTAGGYFQLWGDLSKLPNITAYTINYAASPFPATAPSAAPTAKPNSPATPAPSPTVAPTPPPSITGMPVNGVEWPTSFTPFSSGSPWNTVVSGNPTIASYSASVIAAEFGSGNNQPVRDQEAGIYDYGHPIYYAATTDPVINVACNMYCPSTYPKTMYMPAKARPALGGDAHMAVVQPDGTEIDMWATYGTPGGRPQTRNWQAGDSVTAGNVTSCGNFFSGTGVVAAGPAATAGGGCLSAGLLRANELASGHINHALFMATQCANGSQYPAFAGAVTDPCTVVRGRRSAVVSGTTFPMQRPMPILRSSRGRRLSSMRCTITAGISKMISGAPCR